MGESGTHKAKGERTDWLTPPEIVEAVHATFKGPPEIDPCSHPASKVGADESWLLPEADGLDGARWRRHGRTFYVNPPFGPGLSRWVEKCVETAWDGGEIVLVLPAAVETRWWQTHIWPKAERIAFPDRRIQFINPDTGERERNPPMACALVYWGDSPGRFHRAFRGLGWVAPGGGEIGRAG